MALALKQAPRQAPTQAKRTTFAAWLADEMRDRGHHYCSSGYDIAEFARQYGFAPSTVRAWLSGRRAPSMKRCRELAEMLDLTMLEVVCAAGHLHWSDVDDYTRAYADTDNWATTGEL